jgi:hypothetical protein
VKAEIEKEIGMDEVRRQLHNEAIMDEMKRIETEVKKTASTVQASINDGVKAMDSSSSSATTGSATPTIDPAAGADPAAGGSHVDIADTIAAQDNVLPPRKDLEVSEDPVATNDTLEDIEQKAGSQVERAQSERALPEQNQESIAATDEKARNV